MRAMRIENLEGPDRALAPADLPDPEPSHMLTPGAGVVVDVRAAGVSFPEVLQTRGEYQLKPPLPFVPGSEVAGVVRSAPDGASVSPGDRVAAFCVLGGFAEVAVAPEFLTFPLPEALDFAQGAALDPQLPHRLLRAEAARPPGRGRDRPRPRRGRRRRDGRAAGRQGARRPDDRGGLLRREGAGRARGRRRRGRALGRRRGATRPRSCPAAAWTSCSTRSAATASRTRCGRWGPRGGSSSSASPAARSPR